jgi:hypothetical protein
MLGDEDAEPEFMWIKSSVSYEMSLRPKNEDTFVYLCAHNATNPGEDGSASQSNLIFEERSTNSRLQTATSHAQLLPKAKLWMKQSSLSSTQRKNHSHVSSRTRISPAKRTALGRNQESILWAYSTKRQKVSRFFEM